MKLSEKARIELDKIQKEFNNKSKDILLNEAKEQNKYNVGDIIQDHFQIGLIKQVVYSLNVSLRMFDVSYRCDLLTKQLKPFKNNKQAEKRGLNVIVIGERQNLKNRRTEILVTNYKNNQPTLF